MRDRLNSVHEFLLHRFTEFEHFLAGQSERNCDKVLGPECIVIAVQTFVPGTGELAVYCGALVGSSLGFLWFNSYPAQMFMGDVGSLAIGGTLGAIAIITKQEILLAIVGGIFVMEALSVIIQVGFFKISGGKRIFLMAPFHHHFEKKGWAEPKVVVRFWIISIILALVALATLKLR